MSIKIPWQKNKSCFAEIKLSSNDHVLAVRPDANVRDLDTSELFDELHIIPGLRGKAIPGSTSGSLASPPWERPINRLDTSKQVEVG
jgi:hypothetical protein